MLKTKEDMHSILAMLMQTDSWNPHAKFFLYIDTDLGADAPNMIRSFFIRLWQEFIVNIVIMYPDMEHFHYKVGGILFSVYTFKGRLEILSTL